MSSAFDREKLDQLYNRVVVLHPVAYAAIYKKNFIGGYVTYVHIL